MWSQIHAETHEKIRTHTHTRTHTHAHAHTHARQNGRAPHHITATALRDSSAKKVFINHIA